jgi:hypothetical protein
MLWVIHFKVVVVTEPMPSQANRNTYIQPTCHQEFKRQLLFTQKHGLPISSVSAAISVKSKLSGLLRDITEPLVVNLEKHHNPTCA